MKKTFKLFGLIMIVFALFLQSSVFATGGQASGTTNNVYNKTVSYFFELARAMETASGTLAKPSNISMEDYTDSSGNGIDCHLEKNTEYGTITLLAASEFGNATSTDTASTGNNGTGVFQMSNGKNEYVANINRQTTSEKISTSSNTALIKSDLRYVDEYIGFTKYSIPGDGIIETDGWGGNTDFLNQYGSPLFQRGFGGFFGYKAYNNAWKGDGVANPNIGCRAVVVCGPGL